MDPRTGQKVRDPRSELMRAKAGAINGEKTNFCPYGCTEEEIDEHGYCHHLIGFTTDNKTYEPMVLESDGAGGFRRIVKVDRKIVGGKIVTNRPKIEKGDQLVRITISSRVYRNVESPLAAVGTDVADAEEEDQ